MARKNQQISEDEVMKALGALEDEAAEAEEQDEGEEVEEQPAKTAKKSVAKSGARTALPATTDEANGGKGLSKDKGGTGPKGKVSVSAEESEDGTGIGKSEEHEDEEDAEEVEEVEEVEEPQTRKSVRDSFRSNDTIRKGVEVSPFLESLTDVFGDEMDKINKSIEDAHDEQAQFNARLQKAVIAIGNTVVSIAKSVQAFGDQPARARKSALTKSEVTEREFAGGHEETEFSKSQVLGCMTDMVVKGELPAIVVSTYETTDYIPPEHVAAITSALQAKAGRR